MDGPLQNKKGQYLFGITTKNNVSFLAASFVLGLLNIYAYVHIVYFLFDFRTKLMVVNTHHFPVNIGPSQSSQDQKYESATN